MLLFLAKTKAGRLHMYRTCRLVTCYK